TTLLKRIQKLDTVQSTYMPGLRTDLAGPSGTTQEIATSTPERIPLHLPSSLPPDHRMLICMADIPTIEDQLCFAQASEALTML
ncbi:hypothetical protein L208DRAFT_1345024, partial [Tricholoma matsutake]